MNNQFTQDGLLKLLAELCSLPVETEWLEFKEARTGYNSERIGRYFSALSNETNLKGRDHAWLVFGVDKSHAIVGSQYRSNQADLESLKYEISVHLSPAVSFLDIFVLPHPAGRVVMFQIPAAPKGMPVTWKGHYYGRNGESLSALNIEKLERIRAQATQADWSSSILQSARLDDLDPEALRFARDRYAEKHPELTAEILNWDDSTFLHKLKIVINSQLTRAAIVLLGKPESSHLLANTDLRLSWILQDQDSVSKDYQHYGLPFLLSAEKVSQQIRNLTYRYMGDESLFPTEVPQYDTWVLREALHNCIAHQDFTLGGKINILEKTEELVFSNLGTFIPGSIESVIQENIPPERYRNPLLAQAMVDLNMIDTIGSGIRRMFTHQRQRFFPLPEYTIDSVQKRVEVRIYGRLLSEEYARILQQMPKLDLPEVMLLDNVQKGKPVSAEGLRTLRKLKLVEGRSPNLHVSASVASAINDKASYTRNRGLDKTFYEQLILEHLKKFGSASREEINEILLPKLPEVLDDKQKSNKVKNLLSGLSGQSIINTGSRTKPVWKLLKP